jgi:hypothetical protein
VSIIYFLGNVKRWVIGPAKKVFGLNTQARAQNANVLNSDHILLLPTAVVVTMQKKSTKVRHKHVKIAMEKATKLFHVKPNKNATSVGDVDGLGVRIFLMLQNGSAVRIFLIMLDFVKHARKHYAKRQVDLWPLFARGEMLRKRALFALGVEECI